MIKLGSLRLANNLLLAPMLNITTAPFRHFCRYFHAVGLVHVPMLYTKKIISNPKSIDKQLQKIKQEKPISIQLIGGNPVTIKDAIELLESYDHDVIDINAGCPSKRAISAKEGGFLLNNLEKLKELTEVALKYSSVPVSLKIRTGFEERLNVDTFSTLFKDSNLEFLTIHARRVKDGYGSSTLDLDTLKMLKERLDLPIVGNGDIHDIKIVREYSENVKVDAMMIGRASIGNPAIFKQIHDYMENKDNILFKNSIARMEQNVMIYEKIIQQYLDGLYIPISNEDFIFQELKRNSIWLTKGIKDSTFIRSTLSKAKCLRELKLCLTNYFHYTSLA